MTRFVNLLILAAETFLINFMKGFIMEFFKKLSEKTSKPE